MKRAKKKNPILESIAAGAAAGGTAVLVGKYFEKQKGNPKPAGRMVKVLGHIVREGSAKHARLLATKKHAEDLQKSETGRGRNSRRRNTGSAAQAFEDFHGRTPTEVIESHEALMVSGDYHALGDDPEIWLVPVGKDVKAWGKPSISFASSEGVKLAANVGGTQLYFIGSREPMPLDDLEEAGFDTSKRFIGLGEVFGLSYKTEKSFDNFDSITYAHRMGEDTGERPQLVYDKDTRTLLLVGGAYRIAPVDGELGASPGIVN